MNTGTILTKEFKKKVLSSGIDLIGITSTSPFTIRGDDEKIVDPKKGFEDAQSVIVAGLYYYNKLNILPSELGKPRGRLSYGG